MNIIKITSMYCTSCIIMENIFNEYKKSRNLSSEEYDIDEDEDKVKELNIGKILPVFILQKDNREIRIIGEKSKKEFFKILDDFESGEVI